MEHTQDSPPVTEEEDQAAKVAMNAQPNQVEATLEPMPNIDPAVARYIDLRIGLFRDEMVACGQIPPAPKG